jgi:hypothetical protein
MPSSPALPDALHMATNETPAVLPEALRKSHSCTSAEVEADKDDKADEGLCGR